VITAVALSTASSAISFVLGRAAWHKMQSSAETERALGGYAVLQFVPLSAGVLARLLVVLEFVIAILLLVPLTRFLAAVSASVLFLVMSVVVGGSLVAGGVPERCGCFGADERGPTWMTAFRALALSALASAISVTALDDAIGIETILGTALTGTVVVAFLAASAVRTATRAI
jgi:hypothetical protein